MKNKEFPPGSEKAIENGCRCPVIDNGRGRGYHCSDGSQFVVNGDCPLHGEAQEVLKDGK